MNDLESVTGFLKSYENSNPSVQCIQKTLSDTQATRENVLAAFSIFNQAKDGDTCLFYFSGHGTQVEAPEIFDEPNNLNQAIVCYSHDNLNSPLIIDKELSYLIYEATQNKTLHFLVITDCCHAGSNTKSASFLVKGTPNLFPPVLIENYYGYEHYNRSTVQSKAIVRAPRGSHIKLAAALDHQEAKQESGVQHAKPRSLFTLALFDVIYKCGGRISYQNLISKVRARIRCITRDQSPQVELVGLSSQAKQQYFLNYSQAEEPLKIAFRKTSEQERVSNEWIIEAGHMHGIAMEDRVLIEDRHYHLREVCDTFSRVSIGLTTAGLFKDGTVYLAEIIPSYDHPLRISFGAHCLPEAIDALKTVLEEQSSRRVKIVENTKSPEFFISTDDQAYGLSYCDSNQPIFKRPYWQGAAQIRIAARIFFTQLEAIAKYLRLISLENHRPGIAEEAISILLEHPDEPYRYQGVANQAQNIITKAASTEIGVGLSHNTIQTLESQAQGLGNKELETLTTDGLEIQSQKVRGEASTQKTNTPWHEDHVFRYFYDQDHPGGPWFPPAFQLQLLNQSDEDIWVSVLYCGSGYQERVTTREEYLSGQSDRPYFPFESKLFCSTNEFLPSKLIRPKEKVLMEDTYLLEGTNQYVGTHLIELSILDDYLDSGWSEIKDVIKVFVSKQEFQTDCLNYEGVEINTEHDNLSSDKSLPLEEEIPKEGWRTYTTGITIIRPKPLGYLRTETNTSPIVIGPLSIQGHLFFRAMVIASTMEELLRGISISASEHSEASPRQNSSGCNFHPCKQFREDYAQVELITLTEGIGQVEGCSVIEFCLPRGEENVNQDNPLCINLATYQEENWQIKAIGYDPIEEKYDVLHQTSKSSQIEIYSLPNASYSPTPGLTTSIKIFFMAFSHRQNNPERKS